MIGNRIADKTAKVSKNSQQNNSEKVHDSKIPEERYTSPEERQKIINKLRLI